MESNLVCLVFTVLVGGIVSAYVLLRKANEWFYMSGLGAKQHKLPPGDMGWPFIGNMLSFFRAFRYGDPDSFISRFDVRFGEAKIYRTFIFGSPSMIVAAPEACRRVLMDDENFGPGWPKSILKLMGKKGFHGISAQEHRRLRRLTAAPIKGQEALSVYLSYIEDLAVTSLEEWAKTDRPMEFLNEMRRTAFKVIMHIVMSSEIEPRTLEAMENEYALLCDGFKAMAIDLPGFAYHRALKARKNLMKIFQGIVEERRAKRRNGSNPKRDMMDLMMEAEDEEGNKLSDEEIIDILIIYLFAGHESSAHATTWAIIFLQEHPYTFQKAKEEQEAIIKRRPSTETRLSLKDIRQMEYISKVIDETLRLANFSFVLFREAKTDVNLNGYIIPKGWKVLPWIRDVHMDHQLYVNPKEFDPSRWNDRTIRPGTFVPFGIGSRMCPGADLAKLTTSVFLHYFLLGYKLEQLNPRCAVKYLPLTKPVDNCLARLKRN